jgi:hypothetical protein
VLSPAFAKVSPEGWEAGPYGYNVRMSRPRGLLLTAWMMVALMVAGWVRGYYWPHHAHLAHPSAHLHVFTTIFLLVINIIVFVCIFYYVRGRNWARIAVLLTSILSILYLPLRWRQEDIPGHVISAAWGLLGIFFLYWLSTSSVREFFKRRPAATIERS